MTTIATRFPAGRYHATPWGSHVNEGVVEWPPSPWRILRSLLATGFSKLGWKSVPDDARSLIERLAGLLPEYRLPRGELAHTRHYMPIVQGRDETTTKVLDTFVRLRSIDPLLVRYPVELPPTEWVMLNRLVQAVSYFGRAESWADAELVDDGEPDESWCRPCGNGTAPLAGGDQIPLLAPIDREQYAAWREQATQATLDREAKERGTKLTKSQIGRILAAYPVDLLECLLTDSAFLQKHGWSQPPGSRRVLYSRPPHTLEPSPTRTLRRHGNLPPAEAALLALSSDTARGNLLPLMTRCLRQAEFVHEALVSILTKEMGVTGCAAIFGRDANGNKLESGHQHAHYLPLDLDEDGRLDHVLIYAAMGLDVNIQRAITRLRRTWTKGSDTDIFVSCVGFGDLDLFRRQLRSRSGRTLKILPPEPATVWSSVTPYVPARHLKLKNHRYTVEDDIRVELRSRGLPEPVRVDVFQQQGQRGRSELIDRRLLHFVRTRRDGKPQPPRPHVFGLRLRLEHPIAGPLLLGYASHYGLGLFGAED